MTSRQLALQWFDEVWVKRNPAAIHELMDPNAVGTSEGGVVIGPADFEKLVYVPFLETFPDLALIIERVIAEEDEAVVRWTAIGTQLGPMGAIPASGRKLRFTGMTWFKFKDGKIIEGADSYNLHAVIEHLTSGAASATVQPA